MSDAPPKRETPTNTTPTASKVLSESDFWSHVPSVEDMPAPGSTTRASLATTMRRANATRRTMLKAAGVAGGALALNVVSWLPPFGSRPAHASVRTEWKDSCAGYDNWGGYDNNSAICVGGTYGSGYCGGDGWFLQYSGTCFASGAIVVCGTGGFSARNAWRWTHNGTRYRCADGMQYWCGGSGFFICSQANPTPV